MIDQPSLLMIASMGAANTVLSAPQRSISSGIAVAPVAPADAPEKGVTRRADTETPVATRETAAAGQDKDVEALRSSTVKPPVSIADMWRTRMDPETFRMFTEVIDLETRDARYRVPPTPISDAAKQEGELLSQRERWKIGVAQSIEV